MHRHSTFLCVAAVVALSVGPGCINPPGLVPVAPPALALSNPLFVPGTDHEQAWERVVSVIHNYFRVEHEEPVRLAGNMLTEGRIETFPLVGATILEPWHGDSVSRYDRVESTLQSIRRQAMVRVIPDRGGFWLDVAVFKELEEVTQPDLATAGNATFRYENNSLTRVVNAVGEQDIHVKWIRQGRDAGLEQRLLAELQAQFAK